MGIMNAPMMLAASSGDDVDFMVHGLIPLKFFGHKVWITTTHVTTLIVMVFIIVLALISIIFINEKQFTKIEIISI